MSQPLAAPSPERIFTLLHGFHQTAVLKAALELDLFTHLAAGADTVDALAQRTHAAARGVRILCNALVVYGLLEKSGEQYRPAPDAALFLNRNSPAYLGGVTGFLLSPTAVDKVAHLTDAVRRGGDLADTPSMQPDSAYWVEFARSMAAMMAMPAQWLAELLQPEPLAPCRVLDIAAGHGLFGIAMARRNPRAEIFPLDWAPVLKVAEENAERMGVADRYHPLPGGAFDRDLGSGYDWVLLTNFLHHFDFATCVAFLRRLRPTLNPGGQVAVLEAVVDADEVNPPFASLFNLIMLTTTPAGKAYTWPEFQAMFGEAGFSHTALRELPAGWERVVVARV
jgi:cyclopropane fatty-acyl-phospholipid synthase-like methyltransferase